MQNFKSVIKISKFCKNRICVSFTLVPRGHASLLTRKPDLEQAIDMVAQYIKYYRESSFNSPDDYYLFTKDALKTVIKECDFHPRGFLSRFNRIVGEGVSKGVKEITTKFTRAVPEVEEEEGPPGVEEL